MNKKIKRHETLVNVTNPQWIIKYFIPVVAQQFAIVFACYLKKYKHTF